MSAEDLGRVIYSFFLDYLTVQKGLRPASIRSYRDTLRLFLQFRGLGYTSQSHSPSPSGFDF